MVTMFVKQIRVVRITIENESVALNDWTRVTGDHWVPVGDGEGLFAEISNAEGRCDKGGHDL